MSELPSYAEIRTRSGQSCTLRHGDGCHDAGDRTLQGELSHVGECVERHGYEQFSLIFRVAEEGPPHQGIHAVHFDDGMQWDIFLVPIERSGSQVMYEACFNRKPPSA